MRTPLLTARTLYTGRISVPASLTNMPSLLTFTKESMNSDGSQIRNRATWLSGADTLGSWSILFSAPLSAFCVPDWVSIITTRHIGNGGVGLGSSDTSGGFRIAAFPTRFAGQVGSQGPRTILSRPKFLRKTGQLISRKIPQEILSPSSFPKNRERTRRYLVLCL